MSAGFPGCSLSGGGKMQLGGVQFIAGEGNVLDGQRASPELSPPVADPGSRAPSAFSPLLAWPETPALPSPVRLCQETAGRQENSLRVQPPRSVSLGLNVGHTAEYPLFYNLNITVSFRVWPAVAYVLGLVF